MIKWRHLFAAILFIVQLPSCNSSQFRPLPLTKCYVYSFRNRKPLFSKIVLDGDTAFYGIILQSTSDPEIEKYLISKARGLMWEYHTGYGVTPADSAFVLEGLMRNKKNYSLIKKSLIKIIQSYWSREEGAFYTVLPDLPVPEYWKIPEVTTNAHLGYLIAKIFQDPRGAKSKSSLSHFNVKEIIQSVAHFVASRQLPDGSWEPTWFPSRFISIFLAVRFLKVSGSNYSHRINLALSYTKRTQLSDGSWNNSLLDTIFALRTLNLFEGNSEQKKRAEEYIKNALKNPVNVASPILYYAPRFKDGDITFFDCYDATGKVTSALARLALDGK